MSATITRQEAREHASGDFAHLHRSDAAFQHEREMLALHAALRGGFLDAIGDSKARVPLIGMRQGTLEPYETQQSVIEATQDALDAIPAAEALLAVLQGSECPLVLALRFALAEAHADQLVAEGIGEVRS